MGHRYGLIEAECAQVQLFGFLLMRLRVFLAVRGCQEFAFFFQTQTTFYSCSSLEAKLERILKLLGATPARVRVRSVDCQSPGRIVRMPRIIINVHAPVEATPEAYAERDKNKSTRELAARVRGDKEDPEALAAFPAQWQRKLKVGFALRFGDHPLDIEVAALVTKAARTFADELGCTMWYSVSRSSG